MIDTIVLTLDQDMFRIFDHDKFEPSTRGLFNSSSPLGSRGYINYKQYPTKIELKNGIYKPRLTVTKRFNGGIYQIMMKVEFSAPKMLYKNNFDELQESDFEPMIAQLQNRIREMGVFVFGTMLAGAYVSSIHYSKNVVLTNGLTPFSILKEIQKANISQRLDFNQTDYRNEGHSFKFRTNSYEIAFYDKMKDMQKANLSEKRAVEKDNAIQMSLFDELQQYQKIKPLEVIRMEIRLNQRLKIRQVLKTLDLKIEPKMRLLFKEDLAKKILLYYLDQIESAYPKSLRSESQTAKSFISQFIVDNPSKKIKDTVLAFGFYSLLKELSVREIREVHKKTPVSSWYRFAQQMNSYNYSKNAASPFDPLRSAINEFRPLKTAEFQAQLAV